MSEEQVPEPVVPESKEGLLKKLKAKLRKKPKPVEPGTGPTEPTDGPTTNGV